jgi:hypothetical protein
MGRATMDDASLAPNKRTVFRKMEDGAGGVLLHLDTGEYRRLNEMGATIWSLLQGGPTRAELIAALQSQVEDPPADMTDQVDAFLAALEERGLLEIRPRDPEA